MTSDAGFDRKAFWDAKILAWEWSRYGNCGRVDSWLERLAGTFSDSLRFRIELAVMLVGRASTGKRVLDLGCGGGQLFARLVPYGPSRMIGVDISQVAVEGARRVAEKRGFADRVEFVVGDVIDVELPEADIVCALGLLDWLSFEEIEKLFRKLRRKPFLVAISERRRSVDRWVHRAYVHLAYGRRTGGYVPRYYSVKEIETAAARAGYGPLEVIRHPRLRFGAMLHTL